VKAWKWSVVLVSSGANSRTRSSRVPGFVMVLVLALFAAGAIGMAHTTYRVTRYAVARLGVTNEKKKNHNLVKIMRFLEELARKNAQSVEQLVHVEDRVRLKLGLSPVSDDVRKAGVGGPPSLEEIVLASLSDPLVVRADSIRQDIASLMRMLELENATMVTLEDYVRVQSNLWKQFPSVWPVNGRLTSGFGYRYHPFYGVRMFHEGLDIANNFWTPIQCTADGVVASAGWLGDYGRAVQIDHYGSGYRTVYAHLEQTAVVEGALVKRGDIIGYMGNSGRSTGPHLHYEVHRLGKLADPSDFILPADVMVD